ncbi:Stk1 family PASTA domain-containing Ser/Thr kinase [Cryptosporangium arvum]|uniref:non-specific serine/threonine protein kinase n=1 Tax=Cryptosporangium arvum DSM 44712 TaxID=927661 RepID=A0A011AAH2_9ACTN|nr:Stk1 family PASTA domain-containing Ser/Thr kinase [Cryptosporangium arvum]EXG79016.1 protein kinase family protein with PASTA protein [Cryptosporangium arvum DSM 44712]
MTEARLFGGRYEIGHVLGYGGMAEVHMGRDHRLGRDVAIKVLRSDLARDPGFQARFRREAQNAAALNHPAIVSVYDTGEDHSSRDGVAVPYIVMEYVEGLTLKEVLTAEGRLVPQRALEIVADVCAALDFSHRHGIIHRDIKPGNVMLTPQGAVKVMDFGIARAITSASSQMTATSAVIGTAQYLSPEQARGETVDARSDVYSTGCLLYELMVGEPPFTGDNPVSVAYQHVREDPIPPSQRNPEISATIDSIVLKSMAKNPAQRYQSAGEMRADLLRAAAGRPVAAGPVPTGGERTAVLGGGAATRVVPTPGGGYSTSVGTAVGNGAEKRRGATIAVGILAVVALVAVVAFAASKLGGGGGKEVTVADVVGANQVSATRELQAQGLNVTVRTVPSTTEQKGKVTEQNPAAGEKAKEGDKVEISIGGGPGEVAVPDLKGLDEDGAKQRLEQAKLQFKPEDDEDSDLPEGRVTGQDPAPGQKLPENGTVTVRISKANRVLVPDVKGLTFDDAKSRLENAGLKARKAEAASDKAAGTVISQTPDQNTKQNRGTTVTLTVSTGPTASDSPDPDESPSEDPEPSDSAEPTESAGASASAGSTPRVGPNTLTR